VIIKDAQGRKWATRFTQYRDGWYWDARWGNHGQSSSSPSRTKARAVDAARRAILSRDAVAEGSEYFRRVMRRGSECRLTAGDHEAIRRAGQPKRTR
jgi:hypothetical protein